MRSGWWWREVEIQGIWEFMFNLAHVAIDAVYSISPSHGNLLSVFPVTLLFRPQKSCCFLSFCFQSELYHAQLPLPAVAEGDV